MASRSPAPQSPTTQVGYINRHHQEVVRKARASGSKMIGQSVYELRCRYSYCGVRYGEDGINIKDRKCPKCQDGAPGLPVPEEEATLFG